MAGIVLVLLVGTGVVLLVGMVVELLFDVTVVTGEELVVLLMLVVGLVTIGWTETGVDAEVDTAVTGCM